MEFMQHSTIHGFPHIAHAKTIAAKTLWVIFIVAALATTLYFTTSVIIQFINQPTSTALVIINPEAGIQFPLITICSLYRLSKRRAAVYGIYSR